MGFSFRLSSSLQYTIRVFSGCSSSLHWAKRFSIVCRISFACCSVLQCTSASSAYLSNDTSGCFFLIHSSNAWCMNIFARSGLHTPPCGVPLCRFSSISAVQLPLHPVPISLDDTHRNQDGSAALPSVQVAL